MSSVPSEHGTPRVAAILVVNDGEVWLPSVLRSLRAQDHPDLRIVAVDNGSKDGSREILQEHLGEDELLTVNRSAGFGRAVNTACRHPSVVDADAILLVHDDLALAPDAVSRLVGALESDPALAAVGPKLREWSTQPILQQVGMTVDRFGRAESPVERGELDQGQLDARRETLYVSSAGMLLRADAFRELGGFDPRFSGLRDDLDLCWRAWLTGRRVEVVPEAVGYHVAAGSRGARPLWSRRAWQARFLSERHALASLIKNYSLRRLAWTLPLTLLLGLAKLVGFALTRRFTDAGATVRAYLWNAAKLPGTLRLRREVQRSRRRTDAELSGLFATGLPRMRHYVDAIRDWLAGPDAPAMHVEEERPASERRGLIRLAVERPAVLAGALLAVAYVIGLIPLLGQGQLLGGAVLPWPENPVDFLRSYASPIAGDPLAAGASASPIQALLGGLGAVLFGNAWLAQRLVVLGLVPLAWLAALRAGRLVTSLRWPRVLGATLYALSPVVLGALAQARLGELIVAALLPAMVVLTARVSSARAARGPAWRATAWLALAAATAIAAAPGLWLVVVPVLLVGLGIAAVSGPSGPGRPVARMLTASGGALALLAPWLWDLLSAPGALAPPPPSALPAWRALALAPETFPGMGGVGGPLAAAVTGGVVLLALILGLRLRPLPVTALVVGLVLSAGLAWGADRLVLEWVWSPALLLPAAAALAGLGVVAARTLGPALRNYTFGLPQLIVLVVLVPLLAGLGAAVWSVGNAPWEALDREAELVPPYVAAEADRLGPYRIMVLDADAQEARWGVTEADGPSMLSFGTVSSPSMEASLDDALARVLAGDLEGGARLGLANVRYVILSDEDPELRAALTAQPDLEPMVAGGGRVFMVRSWLPRAAVLPADVAERVLETGEAGELRAHAESGLARTAPGVYEGGTVGEGETVVVSEQPGLWQASAAGRALSPLPAAEGAQLQGFAGPDGAQDAALAVEPAGGTDRTIALAFQALVLLGLVSLILRPPGIAREPGPGVGAAQHELAPPPGGAVDGEPPLEARLRTAQVSTKGGR